jgi:hypothetical protein
MSTIDRPDRRVLPPLQAGQTLDQRTFHERYAAMPPGTWAELIGGVVHMPSPLFDDHGGTGDIVAYLLVHYLRFTPGLRSGGNVSTILGDDDEVQPDHQLRILPARGGRAQVVGGYVQGAPELVFEVSRSSKHIDLGPKKLEYERAGVPEYVVVELDPERVHWFRHEQGRYVEHAPGPDGVFRSEVFPGLWLDPAALYAEDLDALIAALERGLATPEHAAFVARLAAADRGP